jgi:N-acetylglucosaminyldiphosphoundecaprenol N-acetyl-beta-D-mannosaminyltransferase
MRVDGTSYDRATDQIIAWAKLRESRYVCEAPVHMVMESYDSAEYRAVINGADLVTPGGMPVVWMLRALGLAGQPRVYGPQLTLHVCAAAAAQGLPVGFYGGSQKAVTNFARRMTESYPGLPVAYVYSPPFRPLTAEEKTAVIADIQKAGCQILFVGLGCPRQERWMAEFKGRLPLVMLGVGAAFDFLSGEKPQAPAWLQRMGLEWLFRLTTEPRRLWFRYCYHNPRFVMLAVGQLIRDRLARFGKRVDPPVVASS